MSDEREMLEMAAKAAGIVYDGFDEGQGCDIWWLPDQSRYDRWNPLESDGDALRLAVRLWIHIDFFEPTAVDGIQIGSVECRRECDDDPIDIVYFKTRHEAAEATRLAIVRAAAEIGMSMP